MNDLYVYIHIPFCDHKCIYCDFYSIINYDNKHKFLESIKKEIEYYSSPETRNRTVRSIFFGGGTPSFMEPEYIGEILNRVKSKYNVAPDAEITLETNPGTVDRQKLEGFRKAGINRLSIGIQSFDDAELKFLTRIHNSETAVNTVKAASKVFDNISIDLIFNLPGQTKEKWQESLDTAVSLPVKHVSAYSLILEKGTILNKMVLDGSVVMQDDDFDADLYERTIEYFEERGFRQYEVSNYARPGFESVHNKAYWEYKEYLGFGPSAHSFLNGVRYANFSSLNMYIAAVENKGHGKASEETLTSGQMLDEYVMLALRSRGIDKKEFAGKFGKGWLEKSKPQIDKYKSLGLIDEDGRRIYLTAKGYAVSDEIISLLLK